MLTIKNNLMSVQEKKKGNNLMKIMTLDHDLNSKPIFEGFSHYYFFRNIKHYPLCTWAFEKQDLP